MDGLLLDTEGFYAAVQEKILARYGKVFDWSVKAKMMGKTTAESTRILFEECGLTGLLTPEQFLEEREIMLKELLPSCVAMPGEEDSPSNFSVSGMESSTNPWCIALPLYDACMQCRWTWTGRIGDTHGEEDELECGGGDLVGHQRSGRCDRIAEAEADVKVFENKREAVAAPTKADLTTNKAAWDKKTKVAEVEAAKAVAIREAELIEVKRKNALRLIEKLKAEQLSMAIV